MWTRTFWQNAKNINVSKYPHSSFKCLWGNDDDYNQTIGNNRIFTNPCLGWIFRVWFTPLLSIIKSKDETVEKHNAYEMIKYRNARQKMCFVLSRCRRHVPFIDNHTPKLRRNIVELVRNSWAFSLFVNIYFTCITCICYDSNAYESSLGSCNLIPNPAWNNVHRWFVHFTGRTKTRTFHELSTNQ